ncbi:MAG: toll/interleukin-1 receptor domain-containing protein, partial [Sphaerospermopsis sp. SIO1G2]|nr:toll/interleukin-1 receptor domain-containing protein [Sphaerospermopsis sp. SIO1G2]
NLKPIQFIDFTQYQDDQEYHFSANQLLKEIKKDSSDYEKSKILLVKAKKWQQQNKNPSLLLRGYNLQHFGAWLKVAKSRENHLLLPLQEEFIDASLNHPVEYSLEVFISYSRTDSDLARKINNALQELGKTTWFDQESIATGADFNQEICQGIEKSDNFVFIISPKSINSRYCVHEVEYAQKLNKRIVTILHHPLSAVDKQKLPPALANIQWLDFNKNGEEFYANFNELIRTLDIDREHIKSHTKWSQKALDWHHKDKNIDLLLRGIEFAFAQEWLNQADLNKKNPQPTKLQREFINKSQQEIEKINAAIVTQTQKEKKQILILRLLLFATIITVIFAGFQSIEARKQSQQA